ncbi:Uncharacterised protein [Mycobacteroides abscessus subsp. abscessus]|nr:Uncharacterised protein [Mycobacteroides abscessus subsp. abscessus]
MRFGSRVWPRLSLRNGRPITRRRAAVDSLESVDTNANTRPREQSRYGLT